MSELNTHERVELRLPAWRRENGQSNVVNRTRTVLVIFLGLQIINFLCFSWRIILFWKLVESTLRLQPCLSFQPICNAGTFLPYVDTALAADRVETDSDRDARKINIVESSGKHLPLCISREKKEDVVFAQWRTSIRWLRSRQLLSCTETQTPQYS